MWVLASTIVISNNSLDDWISVPRKLRWTGEDKGQCSRGNANLLFHRLFLPTDKRKRKKIVLIIRLFQFDDIGNSSTLKMIRSLFSRQKKRMIRSLAVPVNYRFQSPDNWLLIHDSFSTSLIIIVMKMWKVETGSFCWVVAFRTLPKSIDKTDSKISSTKFHCN